MRFNKVLKAGMAVSLSVVMLTGCVPDIRKILGRGGDTSDSGYESDGGENIAVETDDLDGISPVKTANIYNDLLEKQLIPEYGLASEEVIPGGMRSSSTPWVNPSGIIAAYQKDMDRDGIDDLLVFYWAPYDYDYAGNQTYHLNALAYTVQDNQAVLTDEKTVGFGANKENVNDVSLCISQADFYDTYFGITYVEIDGVNYLLCEEHQYCGAFVDGTYNACYAYTLNNGMIEKAFALAQDGWGSSDFSFTAYEYISGELSAASAYSGDGSAGTVSIEDVFAKYLTEKGIRVKDYTYLGSVIGEGNTAQSVVEVRNQHVGTDGDIERFEYTVSDATRLHSMFGKFASDDGKLQKDGVVPAEEASSEETPAEESGNGEKTVEELMNAPDAYLIPDINTRKLTEDDLKKFNADTIRYARNEMYARHGRMFKDETLQNYFNKKNWYSPTVKPDEFNDSVLNEYEEYNRDLIVDYEKKLKQ